MKDLFLFGLNSLLLLVAWKFAFRPALLSMVRDFLFDGRDRWRSEFLARGGDLSDPYYEHIRGVYNLFIRYLELASLPRQIAFSAALEQRPRAAQHFKNLIDSRFEHPNAAVQEKGFEHRKYIALWTKIYLLHSSIFSIVLLYGGLLVFHMTTICKKGFRLALRQQVDESFDDTNIEAACETRDGGLLCA